MKTGFDWAKAGPRIFWACTVIAIVTWAAQPGYVVGWDLNVYRAAMASLQHGHDPYLDAMAIQRLYHAQGPHPAGTAVPFSYVYSPLTLGLVAVAGRLPIALVAAVYWAIYAVAVIATLWVVWQMTRAFERKVFAFLLPLAVFFPGLLEQDVIFSGNVAYILYGAVLATAWVGWRRDRWLPFYAAVVVASCFKAPLLSLVVIAPLSGRRQWWPAAAAGITGAGLFAVQPHLWPSLFRHYLEAVELQFSYNRDFSSSPAGLVANALFGHVPYVVVSAVVYAAYAVPLFAVLVAFSRRFLRGELTLQEWAPLLLVGTVLLNPRIMEYDAAPLAFPLALLAWRFFRRLGGGTVRSAALGLAILFAVVNTIAAHPFAESTWRPTEGLLLLGLFVSGAWTLWRPSEARVDTTSRYTVASHA